MCPLDKYFKMHDIRDEITIVKTLQQNGVAKRTNQTIIERIRYMFSQAKFPKPYGEGKWKRRYLIKSSHVASLDGDISERVWKGRIIDHIKDGVDLNHLPNGCNFLSDSK